MREPSAGEPGGPAIRRKFQVSVETRFVATESDPAEPRYVFAYTITIANHGSEAAQLMNRYWLITDGDGHQKEVHGPGVVGNQRGSRPGRRFATRAHASSKPKSASCRPLRVPRCRRRLLRRAHRRLHAGGPERHRALSSRGHLHRWRHPGLLPQPGSASAARWLRPRGQPVVRRRPRQSRPRILGHATLHPCTRAAFPNRSRQPRPALPGDGLRRPSASR